MQIPFSKPSLGPEEAEAVHRVISSGWLAAGKETEAFEREFSEYISWPEPVDGLDIVRPYCIFTNSCTSALKMAYKWALSVDGQRCLCIPQNTFCATYAAADELGQRWMRYMELTPGGSGLIGDSRVNVHYGGVKDTTPCLIEDSAHRIEANDPMVGKIRCYSFYVTKNMTTGAGGMFVTTDKEIYERARLYWKDGLTTSTADRAAGAWDYRVEAMAGGYDGNDIAAAIGRVQLKKLPELTAKRNAIRDRYNAAFGSTWQGNHLYPYLVDSFDDVGRLISHLRDRGIGAGYHYPGTGWLGVSLPIFPGLTDEQQQTVIDAVKEWADGRTTALRTR